MNEYFTIGETSALFDISVQTLRYYEKVGLIIPAYVNPKSGYRYYSHKQFHYIDRVQYLKGLGLTLDEIKNILQSGRVDTLQTFLRKNIETRKQQVNELKEIISELQWYSKYFEYMDITVEDKPHISYLEERYMLCAPCFPHEPFENIEMRLTQFKSKEEFKNLKYRRHYSFIIDFDDMMLQRFSPTAASIYLQGKPDIKSSHIKKLPAGNYLCFYSKLRVNEWNAKAVRDFFELNPYRAVFVVANEYEDNLVEYTNTPYEVQVCLGTEKLAKPGWLNL